MHIPSIEVGQRWSHKLTSQTFRVVLSDDDEVLLEPEGEGMELTLSPSLLVQEFRCPMLRSSAKRRKPSRQRKYNRRSAPRR